MRAALNLDPLVANSLSATEVRALGHDGESAFAQRLSRLRAALPTLPDKPEETAVSTLRALWLLAGGTPLSAHSAMQTALRPLSAAQLATLDAFIARRIDGEPLAYLTGRQSFMGLELLASAAALIPRAESELLGAAAAQKLRDIAARSAQPPVVVDVCCGSGNLALALAHAVPQAQVHGSDISPEAISLARDNARKLGLESRLTLHTGDLLAPFGAEFARKIDLLVSIPPYVSTAKMSALPREIVGHEPHLAFDGGPFGVRILLRLIREAPPLLRPGGWLGLEVGLGQGAATVQLLQSHPGYGRVETVCDAEGAVRAVLAQAVG